MEISKSNVSSSRQELIQLMQRLNFGTIQGLQIVDGDPVLTPLPRVVQFVKFKGENNARPELHSKDFVLKDEVNELFSYFNELNTGTIETIDVKHGLPFTMNIEKVFR